MNRITMLDASLQKLAFSFNSGNIVLDNFLRSEEAINPYVGVECKSKFYM